MEKVKWKERNVKRQSSFQVEVTATEDNSVLLYEFSTKEFDIGFSTTINSSVGEEYRRYAAPTSGKHEQLNKYDSISLLWDNSYSLWRGKKVRFRIALLSNVEFQKYEVALLEQQKGILNIKSIKNESICENIPKACPEYVDSLASAVDGIVMEFMNNPDVAIHEGLCRSFVIALENILRHGFKFRSEQDTMVLLSPRSKMHEMGTWMETDYWQWLQRTPEVLRDDRNCTKEIMDYEPMHNAKFVGWGRGRAMIFHALNLNLLGKIMENLVKRDTIIEKYYFKGAILRDYEIAKRVVALLSALNGVKFELQRLQEDFDGSFPDNLTLSKGSAELKEAAYVTTMIGSEQSNSICTFQDCTPSRFVLHGESMLQHYVSRGLQLDVDHAVDPGNIVVWQFQLLAGDIQFSISCNNEPMYSNRVHATGRWEEGVLYTSMHGKGPLNVQISFDNSHSMLWNKNISFRTQVVTKADFQESKKSAMDAAQSISWKIVLEKALPRISAANQAKRSEEEVYVQEQLESIEAESKKNAENDDLESWRVMRTLSVIGGPISYMLGASWENGNDATVNNECAQCLSEFSLFKRRHLCESCGHVYCITCSRHVADIVGKGQNLRVCDRCFLKITDKAVKEKQAARSRSSGNEVAAYLELQGNDDYSKYFKMLAVGVPHRAAVREMQKDELDPSIIQIFAAGPDGHQTDTIPTKAKFDTTSKSVSDNKKINGPTLRKIHWTALKADMVEKSVWSKETKIRKTVPAQVTARDIAQLESIFGEKRSNRAEKKGGSKKPKGPVRLLDPRRSNNVSIGLSQFKSIGKAVDIVKVLKEVHPKVLTTERLAGLLEIVPTTSEARRLQNFRGSTSQLGEAEQFLLTMSQISRVSDKVSALLFISQYPSHSIQLTKRIGIITAASKQLMNCDRLARLLEYSLVVGNVMNANSANASASGITLDSLQKLAETKSIDRRLTLLDFLVQLLQEKGEGHVLNLSESLKDISDGSRYSNTVCVSQYKMLVLGLNQLTKECDRERSDDKARHNEAERKKKETMMKARKKAQDQLDKKRSQNELRLMVKQDHARFQHLGIPQQAQLSEKEKNRPSNGGDPRKMLLNEISGFKKSGITKTNSGPSKPAFLLDIENARKNKNRTIARPAFLNDIAAAKGTTSVKQTGAPISNPRKALLDGIKSFGKAKSIEKSETSVSDNPNDYIYIPRPFDPSKNAFVRAFDEAIPKLQNSLSEVEKSLDQMNSVCESLAHYFGESPVSCSSKYVCAVVSQLMTEIQASIKRLKSRGRFPTIFGIEGASDIQVGSRIPTLYGPGLVTALRMDTKTLEVKYGWGRSFLHPKALLLPGCLVITKFGDGLLLEVRYSSGTCIVRFEWSIGIISIEELRPLKRRPSDSLVRSIAFTYRRMDPVVTPLGEGYVVRTYDEGFRIVVAMKLINDDFSCMGYFMTESVRPKFVNYLGINLDTMKNENQMRKTKKMPVVLQRLNSEDRVFYGAMDGILYHKLDPNDSVIVLAKQKNAFTGHVASDGIVDNVLSESTTPNKFFRKSCGTEDTAIHDAPLASHSAAKSANSNGSAEIPQRCTEQSTFFASSDGYVSTHLDDTHLKTKDHISKLSDDAILEALAAEFLEETGDISASDM